jgi:hypothetical protein
MLSKHRQPSPILHLLILLTTIFAATLDPVYARNASTGYSTLTTTLVKPFVIRAAITNPPIQLFDYKIILDMYSFLTALQSTPTPPKVVVFSSTEPDVFITHIDIHELTPATPSFSTTFNERMVDVDIAIIRLLRSLPTIFIGEINGLSTGAGTELAVQCDMRFAGPQAASALSKSAAASSTATAAPCTLLNSSDPAMPPNTSSPCETSTPRRQSNTAG